MILILCFLSLFTQSFAQLTRNGSCTLATSQDFEFQKILGVWYEYGRIPNLFEDPYHKCVNSTYYINEEGYPIIHVDTSLRLSGAWYIWEGTLFPTDTNGIYNLKYPSYAEINTTTVTFMAGDWKSWMISQSCTDNLNQSVLFVWLWSKTTELAEEHQAAMITALEKNSLSMSDFHRTNHSRCPSYRPVYKLPV